MHMANIFYISVYDIDRLQKKKKCYHKYNTVLNKQSVVIELCIE